MVRINHFLQIHFSIARGAQLASELASEDPSLSSKVTAPFVGRQLREILQPVGKIPRKPKGERWFPPGHPVVTGVARRSIQQRDESDSLALLLELARHFVGDVSAEAV